MKRIWLFLLTNLAVLAVIAVSFRLLGLDTALAQGGGLNLGALLAMSAVIGFAGSLVSLAMSKWSAKRMVGAQVIAQPANATEHWLVETVRRQAERTGIGMPEVAIFDASEPNAFATGARRDHALVAVSTGLLAAMSKDEVEAVLAHEVSHIANGDMVTLALIQGVVNTFVVFLSRLVGYFVDRVVFKSENEHGAGFFISSLIAQLLFGVLASMIVMWFSRQREFRADAGAAALAGRERMIAALERLRDRHAPAGLPDQLAASGIAGGARSGLMALFMSHPPLEARIEALRNAARA
ncbi:MAG TPA: protease HtpX [Gammaproteobacteria bacterium]|nr:protease HtpX [Gammaproteobacteria bacterium]